MGWIAARVLPIGGCRYLSGAVLHFEREPADAVLQVVNGINAAQGKRSIAEHLPALTKEQVRELEELLADWTILLEGGARVFTRKDVRCTYPILKICR